jgi:hypothetical protein
MNSKWQFEEFEAGPVTLSGDRIHVTISPTGVFYLNSKALTALDEPDAVILFYDKRLQTIAMKRAPITKRNAYMLKPKDGQKGLESGRTVYAANFCKHYHIRPKRTLAFVKPSIEDGHLILNMHDTTSVQRPRIGKGTSLA